MFYSFSKRPPRVLTPVGGPSMALQDAKDECDINMIIARHDRTGSWSGSMKIPTAIPQFGDFDSVEDFQTAQDTILRAREHFASLPSHVRSRFDNDPVKLLEFVSDKSNLDEAVRLGLAVAPPDVVDASAQLPA